MDTPNAAASANVPPPAVTAAPAVSSPATTPAEDMVLLSSWASMIAFDRRALKLKQDFIDRRRQVIFLSLAATCFSALSALAAALSIGSPLTTPFAILGVILATALIFLRDDVNEFSKTTTWINLRYISELMRTELYLYRMRAGQYRNQPDDVADDLLGAAIEKIQDDSTRGDSGLIGVSDTTSVEGQRQLLIAAGEIQPKQPVLKDLDFDIYKKTRMDGQKEWYDHKIINDYALHRRSSRASRVAIGVGAVAAAVGLASNPQFAVLITITTALSVAITSDSNVNMFGKTYGLFQKASQDLGNLNRRWLAKQNNPNMDTPEKWIEVERDFVEQVEKIAATEREAWHDLVINIQTISDGTIVPSNPKDQPPHS